MSPSEFDTPSGMTKKVAGLGRWFTNLDIQKRHEKLILWQLYYDDDRNPLPDADERYPRYDNYMAINVDRVANIPVDYEGVMGVPITFWISIIRSSLRLLVVSCSMIRLAEPIKIIQALALSSSRRMA